MNEEKKIVRNRAFSQGNIKDYLEKKRKREKEREVDQEQDIVTEIFKISKKTPRTPPKENQKTESENQTKNQETIEMDEIKEMFADIKKEIKEIKAENQEYRKEMELLRQELRDKEEKWEKEKKALEDRIQSIERKAEETEKILRKNNIIIRGWNSKEVAQEQMKKELTAFFKENIEEEVKIKVVHKIGKEMVLAEMENWGEKEKVIKGKYRLRKMTETRKIYIDNDLTKIEREIQRKIHLEAKERRKEGLQVIVGYKKMKIGKEEWKWNESKDILEKKDF